MIGERETVVCPAFSAKRDGKDSWICIQAIGAQPVQVRHYVGRIVLPQYEYDVVDSIAVQITFRFCFEVPANRYEIPELRSRFRKIGIPRCGDLQLTRYASLPHESWRKS
ncbi:hypothetical protein MesoLjLb_55470 [Mesorhizobium sp. L-8-3]|nr:hypothetical protein MesoLjLb_55470 [Mesorhizobium sp. L-8-3]